MSSTSFISHLPPPGDLILPYNRTLPPSSQPDTLPTIFLDAMAVRESVFVHEDHVPLEREYDADDARSHHFVAYASVSSSASSSPPPGAAPTATTSAGSRSGSTQAHPPATEAEAAIAAATENRRRSQRTNAHLPEPRRSSEDGSTAYRVPVGCIRLVPPPHPSLEEIADPGSWKAGKTMSREDSLGGASITRTRTESPIGTPPPPAQRPNHPLHSSEPFIKLGRLCVLHPYRRLGVSRLLVSAALEYARTHAKEMMPVQTPAEVEAAKVEGRLGMEPWAGLVLVHAKKEVQGLWERYGFERDEEKGEWVEEGMEHVGLWRRVGPVLPVPGEGGY